jgi:predicted adenylyl cyclase CyaB
MHSNIEIKARVDDVESLRERVNSLSDSEPKRIRQEDTFFHCPKGRLKLREFSPTRGELIYYERDDSPDPKRSNYIRSVTTDPRPLKSALSASLGVRGMVVKNRTIYQIGQTRIHIDEVDGLGCFVEIEVVLSSGESVEHGVAIAHGLMKRLGIEKQDLIDCAYIDLIEEKLQSTTVRDS